MKDGKKQDSPWKAAALVSALGVDVVFCIFLGYWIGSIADNRLDGGKHWSIIGLLIGLVVGLISAVLIVKKVLEDSDG